ncbi:hypothetical protein BU17DRAFT_63059 [Hysterangium stoloniferum]|nr:hypothetical protein BU17DRAFT_63059 [Hysterangium stoloniferum]
MAYREIGCKNTRGRTNPKDYETLEINALDDYTQFDAPRQGRLDTIKFARAQPALLQQKDVEVVFDWDGGTNLQLTHRAAGLLGVSDPGSGSEGAGNLPLPVHEEEWGWDCKTIPSQEHPSNCYYHQELGKWQVPYCARPISAENLTASAWAMEEGNFKESSKKFERDREIWNVRYILAEALRDPSLNLMWSLLLFHQDKVSIRASCDPKLSHEIALLSSTQLADLSFHATCRPSLNVAPPLPQSIHVAGFFSTIQLDQPTTPMSSHSRYSSLYGSNHPSTHSMNADVLQNEVVQNAFLSSNYCEVQNTPTRFLEQSGSCLVDGM